MKKRNLIYMLTLLLFATTSCKKDYDLKEDFDAPRGAMVTTAFTEAVDYNEQGTTTIMNNFSITTLPDASSATITLQIDSVVPETLEGAITVFGQSVTVSGRTAVEVENFATIDWSLVPPSESGIAYISVVEKVAGAKTTYGKTATVEFSKDALPVMNSDRSDFEAMIPVLGTRDTTVILTMELLDKPTLEELVVPFSIYEDGFSNGVEFTIADPNFRIAVGETSADVEVVVHFNQFAPLGRIWTYFTLPETAPEGQKVIIDDRWSNWIKIGREENIVRLFTDLEYNATDAGATGDFTVTLEVKNILSVPVTWDEVIPVSVNPGGYTEGVDFTVVSKEIFVPEGSLDGTIDITVHGAEWNEQERGKIYLEIDADADNFSWWNKADETNWWTTVIIGN